MSSRNYNLLKSLLSPFMDNWSYESIMDCLKEIKEEKENKKASERPSQTSKNRKIYKKPNTIEIVQRLYPDSDKKDLLLSIANQFEDKKFLPSISDIRNFLEMRGHNSSNVKQRNESFKIVIKTIAELPSENIKEIAKNNSHSGPSELGPLSDAIKQASKSIRGSDSSRDRIESSDSKIDVKRDSRSSHDKEDQKS